MSHASSEDRLETLLRTLGEEVRRARGTSSLSAFPSESQPVSSLKAHLENLRRWTSEPVPRSMRESLDLLACRLEPILDTLVRVAVEQENRLSVLENAVLELQRR